MKLFLLVTFLLVSCQPSSSPEGNRVKLLDKLAKADYYLTGVEMKNKGEDEISWQLYAKRVFVFEKKDRVYLEGIKITFFEKGEVLSVLRAKEAQQDLNKSQTIFQNEVVITSPEGVKLETEEIKWKMEGKKFTSKKKVKITTEQGHIVRGEGIVADLSLKILKIKKPFLK